MKKQLLIAAATATVMAGAAVPAFAADGLSASAGVASAYLWRGVDLGDGSAAVSGDIHYSMAGAYGGVWASSGDSAYGSEYDLYVGYGLELGDVGVDLSLWNYNYSDNAGTGNGGYRDDTNGENTDAILVVSFEGASFKYARQIANENENCGGGCDTTQYYALSYGMKGFTGLIGMQDQTDGVENYTHVDLSYAYNDNLSFTVSKIVDDADDGVAGTEEFGGDDDAIFVVSYNLPIK